jgi:hypothetical protein
MNPTSAEESFCLQQEQSNNAKVECTVVYANE